MRAFEATVRRGGFAPAARELNVTQAAVAQRVRALEAHLSQTLVRRAGKNVQATEAGSKLAKTVHEGFFQIQEGLERLKTDQKQTPVQITCTVFFAQNVLLPLVAELNHQHPDITVSVIPTQTLLDFQSLNLDVAIRLSDREPDWPNLEVEPLITTDLLAVGSPMIVTNNMQPIEKMPWIWSKQNAYEERSVAAFGIDVNAVKNVDLGSSSLQLEAARRGLGLTFTSEILVREDLASGALVRVPVPSPYSVTYYVITQKGPIREDVGLFVSWIKNKLT